MKLNAQRVRPGRFRPVSSKDTNLDDYESYDSGEDEHEYLFDVNRKDGNGDNVEARKWMLPFSGRRRLECDYTLIILSRNISLLQHRRF